MMMMMMMMMMLPLFALRIPQNSGDFHPSCLPPKKKLLEPEIFVEISLHDFGGTQRDKSIKKQNQFLEKASQSSPATCYLLEIVS